MEAEFLEALDYNLFVREHEFGIWKRLLEECRDRAHMSYYDSPRQQQHLVLMTLQTLGLYRIKEDSNYNHIPSSPSSPIWEEQQQYEWESASRLQYESSRYQQFIQSSKLPTHLPYAMQPPITPTIVPPQPTSSYGYCGYMNDYPITNLSHSSWDPLAYSLNRCHDISQQQHNHFAARPISWRNFS
jgi:hypothetical protein